MEKRLYLSVAKPQSIPGISVPAEVVSENNDTLRVRLLEKCTKRNFLGLLPASLEIIAQAGEEFEMPSTKNGQKLVEFLEFIGPEYAIPVVMKDSSGRNGYTGQLTLRYSR